MIGLDDRFQARYDEAKRDEAVFKIVCIDRNRKLIVVDAFQYISMGIAKLPEDCFILQVQKINECRALNTSYNNLNLTERELYFYTAGFFEFTFLTDDDFRKSQSFYYFTLQ
jgi:hypothetical protein